MPQRKLTAKQELFVQEYLVDLNATQAAIRAGYSSKTAQVIGAENLSKPMIAEAVAIAKRKRSEKTETDAAWVLLKLRAIIEADILDILDPKTKTYRPIDEWPLIWRQMCDEVYVKELFERSSDGKDSSWDKVGEVIKGKFAAKLKALEDIGNHVSVKAFPQRSQDINVNVSVSDLTERIHAARDRARSESKRVH